MKRNDIPIILATAAYSWLFYMQSAGINYFIFNTLLVALLVLRNSSLLFSKAFIAAAVGCVVSSFFVMWYGTELPYVADMISMVLLAGMSFDRQSSFIIACLHSIYSIVSGPIFLILDTLEGIGSTDEKGGASNVFKKVALAIIPLMIFFIFFVIYRSGNPIFDQFAAKINFDFISIAWCSFTVGGLILMYGFFKQRVMKYTSEADHGATDDLIPVTLEDHIKSSTISVGNLVYTGVLLLAMLNILLATVNGLDIYYLGILHTTPVGITFSQYLHNGTDSLIVSIILAVSVILFYFKGYLNFYEGNKWLKALTYLWIAQNIMLVISTAYRNTVYIGDYGLTHKRIGVYVYLILCITGLVTTFIKISMGKNNWFLFRKNGWIVYGMMIVACPFDWDSIITEFDISRFENNRTMEVDQRYLVDLGHTNMARIFEYYIVEGKTLRARADSTGYDRRGIVSSDSENAYNQEIKTMIWYEYLYLDKRYAKHSWQSHCMSESGNLHAIEKMIKEHHLVSPVQIR